MRGKSINFINIVLALVTAHFVFLHLSTNVIVMITVKFSVDLFNIL